MAKQKSKISKILQSIDVFGQPVQLFFNGDAFHRTTFGGIITLLILCTVLLLVIVLTIELLSRTSFTTSTIRAFTLNPSFTDISNDFMFSMGIQDPNITLQNSIFSYNAVLTITNNNNGLLMKQTEIPIPLHPCTQQDYIGFNTEYNSYLLNYTMCPNLTNVYIQGGYFSSMFVYVKLNVSQCVNGSNPGVTCASQSYIDNYFANNQKLRFVLYFINSLANLNDYLNPFGNKFIDNLVWLISPTSSLRISTDIYLENSIVNSLDNILGIGNGWNVSTVDYQGIRNDYVFMPDVTKFTEYLDIYLRLNQYYTFATRKFETFPQILSIVGGIWNVLYLVLGHLAARYSRELFQIDLANVLYDFDTISSGVHEEGDDADSDDDDDDDNDDVEAEKEGAKNNDSRSYINDKTKDIEMTKRDMVNIDMMRFPYKKRSMMMIMNDDSKVNMLNNQDFESRFNILRSKRRILQYSGKDLWATFFKCCLRKDVKKKNLLLHKANTKLAADIDIRIILKRLKEVNNIKNIVFDQNQIDIFNFVPPELISLEHEGTPAQIIKIHLEDQKDFLRTELRDYCCKKEEYIIRHTAYQVIKTRNDIISQNLLVELDQEIKEIFQLLDEKKDEINLNITNSSKRILNAKAITTFDNNNNNDNDIDNQLNRKKSISSHDFDPLERDQQLEFHTPKQKNENMTYLKKEGKREKPILMILPIEEDYSLNKVISMNKEEKGINGDGNGDGGVSRNDPFVENKTIPDDDIKILLKNQPSVHIKSSFGVKLLQSIQQYDKKGDVNSSGKKHHNKNASKVDDEGSGEKIQGRRKSNVENEVLRQEKQNLNNGFGEESDKKQGLKGVSDNGEVARQTKGDKNLVKEAVITGGKSKGGGNEGKKYFVSKQRGENGMGKRDNDNEKDIVDDTGEKLGGRSIGEEKQKEIKNHEDIEVEIDKKGVVGNG